MSPIPGHRPRAPDPRPLRPILPSLSWFPDTCNVYVLRDGAHALLIDFGAGGVLDALAEAGVEAVDLALHTHHHRDQCQGDDLLAERGVPIWVPEREAALFAEADAFWRSRRVWGNYDASSVGFSRPRPLPVARQLRDYERFEWRGHAIQVLPTPGHTRGSVTYLVEVDGRRVAFAGDLIAAPGHVHTVHDLQWQYGTPDAVGAALHSTLLLRSKAPDLLLPSHGRPIDVPGPALEQLAANLRRLYELQRGLLRNRAWPPSHPIDQPLERVLPHLWANTQTVAHVYALIADDGRGLLLDYGFPSADHVSGDLRFVEHSLAELRALAGLTAVEAAIPSHYHDDHLAGLPYLQAEHGAEAWIFEHFADIAANADGYNIPCLLPDPIRVDRVLRDGETLTWRGWDFSVFHMPGHTWWALGLVGVVDGTRLAITGDNLFGGPLGPLPAAAPIYRNKLLADSVARGIERLRDFEPELLLTGHTGAVPVDRPMLDGALRWARDLSDALTALVAVPAEVGFALDPNWATLYPYRSTARPGERLVLELRATNHGPREASLRATLALPPGWSATPDQVEIPILGGGDGTAIFTVAIPPDARGRSVLCADLTLGDRRFGQLAEALVDVLA